VPDTSHPLWRTMNFTWEEVWTRYYPPDPEVFLHPADWAEIGQPANFAGAPVKTSLGITRGTMRIFDRETLRYLPEIQRA